MGLSMLGSVRPYFRKHVYGTLEPIDFLFVNSLLISVFIAIFFAYNCMYRTHVVKQTYENCAKLSYSQVGALVVLAGFTVISSMLFFDLEKNFNTPFVNNILLKAVSILALFLVGYFIFEESYNATHMIGIGLTVTGLVILLFNPIKAV